MNELKPKWKKHNKDLDIYEIPDAEDKVVIGLTKSAGGTLRILYEDVDRDSPMTFSPSRALYRPLKYK